MKRAAFAVLSATTLGAVLAENLLRFPLSVPYMRSLGAGAPLLDMRLGYTPGDAYHFFDVLGQTGRGSYLSLLWTIDLVLPALFGSFLFSAVRRGRFRAWAWVGVVAALCDYAENIAITILLLRYPMHEPALAHFASVFTGIKLILYASGLVLSIGSVLPHRDLKEQTAETTL